MIDTSKTLFSLEVFPPKKTSSIDTIYNTLKGINQINADFVSVTYGAQGSTTQKGKTAEIASYLKSEYHMEAVAHLTCTDLDLDELHNILDEFKRKSITNILALRGDIIDENAPRCFHFASDLCRAIREYDDSFYIIGAAYPEKHYAANSIDDDIENLKIKIDNGAKHLITQLFFDNSSFFEFYEKVRKAGINVPIQAGIMPITSKNQIERTVSMCGASLPKQLTTIVNKYSGNEQALRQAGLSFATEQIIEILSNNIAGVHLYTMNNIDNATVVYNNIKDLLV